MRISRPDEPTFEEHRNEQRAAGGQLVEIHVGTVLPGAHRIHWRQLVALGIALARRGIVRVHADGQGSRKGAQRDLDAWLELHRLPLGIDIEELDVTIRKFGRQRADGGEVLAG